MKKCLGILALIIIISFLFLISRRVDGTCNQVEQVNFRGIHFQFPMKVRGALKTPVSGFSRNFTWLQTDSIGGKNISGKWFFEWDTEWNGKKQALERIKENLIYGVAFELREDSCKTDQEIVTEIQKIYPGSYKYYQENGLNYYIWERDCLAIFVKRTYHEGHSIPEVSFCYGLNFLQADMYGNKTGYFNSSTD
ncbi:hypothetical protein [Dyadobacter sp. CY323]|uniref:hypothetical protein n=1 Tax=Dyadobacter sp. CY323 TaxID=2907302 RepID=UPI001F3F386B|nr:hypothetical protein [Dyadobacter sp. CY323]MCE6988996.1 hypothetical protein [Dyadobacter sp. CY323]